MNTELLIQIGGVLHFCILLASALAPIASRWTTHLALLPSLLRQMFWVYGGFIVLVIIGFGTMILAHTDDLASGEPLGRAVSALIAIFWFARLLVQWLVFDAKPFITNRFYRIGYHALTCVFIYLSAVFGYVAIVN